ncbi:hydroxypyruvate isomerase [Roseivivax halotolerans]|uniref:Hydroxypyruvate isomerase n=1 Tax=Roseivivax halotolerans TaxID=93684 RepID=A0A1I5YYN5_9RHOB|nr:TIM barrel protein [Roseivivax halotolerans]SFQ49316.1 hydroxypyruvate isomerase [Roseivivax halotolerans]
MRIAANITFLDFGVPLAGRARLAHEAGFDGVECLFPYALSTGEMSRALDEMPLALINTPVDDWEDGARGRAAVPGEMATFAAEMQRALDYAKALGVPRIHVMAGKASGARARDRFEANLRAACLAAPEVTMLIEPINPHDAPGYYLNDFDLAADIVERIGLPNLKLQFDTWHARRIHGDPLAVWQRHARLVGHVQISGFENRGAPRPDTAEEAAFYEAVTASGYEGWLSAEYHDRGEGFGWLSELRDRLGRATMAEA